MEQRGRKAGRPPQDAALRLERAHRILDSATGLVLRQGYDGTTVEDIARHTGIAKGTIYLHWRTREELFAALLRRERLEMLSEVRRRAEESPGTVGDLLGLLASELMRKPLTRASVLGDSEVLGKLIRRKRDGGVSDDLRDGLGGYLDALAAHGGLRTDLSPAERVTALVSVLYGFLIVSRMLPRDYRPSDERLAELLADAGARTLEPGAPVSADDARAISRATLRFLDLALESARRKLHVSLGIQDPGVQGSGVQGSGVQGSGVREPDVPKPDVHEPDVRELGVRKPDVPKPGVREPGPPRLAVHEPGPQENTP
ncbi:TetR/AcrR family transcriptional regulator [Streptosporangium sp. NPDC051022]|uniref:TetR/AcrR family transcriptional regulator n=1 Tax=Streptosporangium sp. NPDC051022 TaxID=3155752 RepID=UPI003448B5E7